MLINRGQKLLEFTTQEIVGYLRYAQQKSIGQEGGNQWGIHFENPVQAMIFILYILVQVMRR